MAEPGAAVRRQRAALRQEIQEAALRLFIEQGFDRTTIDQIVGAVGISRRSFFRYFGTKEDVLLGDLAARGEAIADVLRMQPAGDDAWSALLAAIRRVSEDAGETPSTQLAIGRMMLSTPSLRARHLEKHLRWRDALVPLVQERLPDRDILAATAIVATALACLDVATDAFVESDGRSSLTALFTQALDAARR